MRKPKSVQEGRAPFTRDEIIYETRRATVALASMIYHYGTNSASYAAATYLGVELPSYEYQDLKDADLDLIPIERHDIYRVVMTAYDYAYQVGTAPPSEVVIDETAHEAAGILSGFPQSDFNGDGSPIGTLNPQKLRQVLDTFFARYSLEKGGGQSVRDLALLANMSEAAVRSSLSTEGLKANTRSKDGPGEVPYSDAIAWLMGRRGFIPTQGVNHESDLADTACALFTASNLDFNSALQKTMRAANLDVDALSIKANVSAGWLKELLTKEQTAELDLNGLQSVAAALLAPIPLFVGKAVQDLLSRKAPK